MSQEYKKCPFCGSSVPHADDCYFTIIELDVSHARILAAWNRRHIPDGYALMPVTLTDKEVRRMVDCHLTDTFSIMVQKIYAKAVELLGKAQ